MYHPGIATPLSHSLYLRPARRGKHKIFIGMAPGVGKTFKMLEEGHQLREDGVDVVIGLLETHGRKETAAKAEGLEMIPRQEISHNGVVLTEMDPDAILARQPQLALIDELAHTNVPGSQREKRYQDVELILEAGIDVYSTVNIQHLESLNDLVARITGVVVRERIPDRLLEEADEVIVVDVTPETLEERLVEGKIYAPEKIEQSLTNFFQRRNLVALRELALREVADNIEENGVRQANHTHPDNPSPDPAISVHERVLVCVSTEPHAVYLLRRGARIANYMNAPLYALFVDRLDRFLTREEALHIETCERLCTEFGGEFVRVSQASVAEAIAATARSLRITQIVLGRSRQSRWKILLRGSFIDQLMRSLPEIDLHIISTTK